MIGHIKGSEERAVGPARVLGAEPDLPAIDEHFEQGFVELLDGAMPDLGAGAAGEVVIVAEAAHRGGGGDQAVIVSADHPRIEREGVGELGIEM